MARTPKTEKPAPTPDAAEIAEAEIKYPRRTERRRRTRQTILRVASDLFAVSGFAATTMQAVADGADIHVTTLFMHFSSKNDVAIALVENGVDKLQARAWAARSEKNFFEFFREEALTYAANRRNAAQSEAALWTTLRNDRELAFAWIMYENGQKDIYAEYIASEFGIDRAVSYLPDVVAALMVECLVLPHQKWAEAPGKRKLTEEIEKAVELAEQSARLLLSGAGNT